MGMTHVFGYATAARVFDLPFELEFECVADATPELAEAAARRFGFRRSTASWQELAADPEIDLLDITAPNRFHKPMALAGIAAGKHIYCEKPLAINASDAKDMAEAAAKAGVTTQVGFNYLSNPLFALAKSMIADGILGDIRSFRGVHAEDYMADESGAWSWRLEPEGGGAFADLGSHVVATAEFLAGGIESLFGDLQTVVPERPGPDGSLCQSPVDDVGRALLRFESGASGIAEANWIAKGQKMQHAFEIYGSRGALMFNQERLNELRYFDGSDPADLQGFKTIMAGPEHCPYGEFCVAPGHQLGYNDLKAIEISGFMQAIAGNGEPFGFSAGQRVQKIVDLVHASSRERRWLSVN